MSSCKECVHYEVCSYDNTISETKCCAFFKPKSRFVELPCEVGQMVYFIPHEKYIVKSKVANITIEPFEEIGFSTCCYGGMYFLSREEAEKALSERSK